MYGQHYRSRVAVQAQLFHQFYDGHTMITYQWECDAKINYVNSITFDILEFYL